MSYDAEAMNTTRTRRALRRGCTVHFQKRAAAGRGHTWHNASLPLDYDSEHDAQAAMVKWVMPREQLIRLVAQAIPQPPIEVCFGPLPEAGEANAPISVHVLTPRPGLLQRIWGRQA